MASVEMRNVSKSFGSVEVLRGINLALKAGEFVVFVGPSGCGKSTLLRMIAGLEDVTAGDLMIDGAQMNDVLPAKRGIAMVFQSYALYPHMTVRENMSFGLEQARLSREVIEARVAEAAAMLQITSYLDRKPRELSGGQRQRVAIGRAITRKPRLFLFDEPLSNLDASLRVDTRIEIAALHKTAAATTMDQLTHDQVVERLTLATGSYLLEPGTGRAGGKPRKPTSPGQSAWWQFKSCSPRMKIIKERTRQPRRPPRDPARASRPGSHRRGSLAWRGGRYRGDGSDTYVHVAYAAGPGRHVWWRGSRVGGGAWPWAQR